jgi:transposase-like protein
MATDWAKIKREYISGNGSYTDLANKYGVSFSTLSKRGASEKWTETREKQLQRISEETERKVAEKIADSESEVAAIMSRIRLKLTQKIERAVDEMESLDTTELRKLVQSFKDMSEAKGGTEEEKQGSLADILAAVKGVNND